MVCPKQIKDYKDAVSDWIKTNKSFDVGHIGVDIHWKVSLIEIVGEEARLRINTTFVKKAIADDNYMMALKILIGHELWHRYQDGGYKPSKTYDMSIEDLPGARVASMVRELQCDFYGYKILKELDKSGVYTGIDIKDAMVKGLGIARDNLIYKLTVKHPHNAGYPTSEYRGDFLNSTDVFDSVTIKQIYEAHKNVSKSTTSLKVVTDLIDKEGLIA